MATDPHGLYERFRRGLLEYHSEVSFEALAVIAHHGRTKENISKHVEKHNAFMFTRRMSPRSGD